MNGILTLATQAVLIGTGATIVLDLWGLCLKHVFGIPGLNYALLGRWIGHLFRGRFAHDNIGQANPVAGEAAIGWIAHYTIGILFAASLLAVMGPGWAQQPTFLAALIFGVATVACPFLITQPGMGMGIAAAKAPNPPVARLRSLAAHTVFGIGLYVAALLVARLIGA